MLWWLCTYCSWFNKRNRRIQRNYWATVNPMNTARYLLAGAGIQTATLAFGGSTPPAK
jgi:hypothetical protein